MIKIEGLNKNYQEHRALEDVNLTIKEGSIHGLLGKNGAGKTTAMNILAGILDYDKGEIYYRGMDYKEHKGKILKNIGYAPQEHSFYEYMNLEEYLNFLGRISGMEKSHIKRRIIDLTGLMGLTGNEKKPIGKYSGGMKQRLSIISAVFNNPDFLILDEPTSALDVEGRKEILELIRNLRERGITVLISTHILKDVEMICDEVTIIHEGRIKLSQGLKELKEEYILPIYDIELGKGFKDDFMNLEALPFIKSVYCTEELLTVVFKDNNCNSSLLLSELLKMGVDIRSFTLREPSLEDIFMRMVGKNG